MNIFDLFPVPKFLKMPAFGLDISDESVKYLKFNFKKTRTGIEFYGERKIPVGIIVNGEILKEKEFTDFLKLNFKDLKIKNAVVSLPEEKAYLDVIKFPKTDYKDIKNGLFAQLENYFPLKAGDAVFDYEILDETSDFFNILTVVYPLTLVSSYRNCLVSAGINPLAFEFEGEAIKRALTCRKNKDFKMIIDFGKTRTSFVIIKDGNVIFTSTIKIGGNDFNKALAVCFSVSEQEAEIIKKEKAKIYPLTNRSGDIKTEEIKIQECLFPILSSLEHEMQKHIDYIETRFGKSSGTHQTSRDINEIILCGGDANFLGLPEYLSLNLKIPAKRANVWQNIFSFENYIPEIEFNESLKYATAIGLALKSKELRWE